MASKPEDRPAIRARANVRLKKRVDGLIKSAEIAAKENRSLAFYSTKSANQAKRKMWGKFACFMLTDGLNKYKEALEQITDPKDICAEVRQMMTFFKPRMESMSFVDEDGKSIFPAPDEKQRARLKQLL